MVAQQSSAELFFSIQSELIKTKVDTAVNQSIKEVVQQITELRLGMRQEMGALHNKINQEVGSLRREIHQEASTLRNDVSNIEKDMMAVKTRLGIRDQTLHQVRGHFIDYTFKASWLLVVATLSGLVSFLATRIN